MFQLNCNTSVLLCETFFGIQDPLDMCIRIRIYIYILNACKCPMN